MDVMYEVTKTNDINRMLEHYIKEKGRPKTPKEQKEMTQELINKAYDLGFEKGKRYINGL